MRLPHPDCSPQPELNLGAVRFSRSTMCGLRFCSESSALGPCLRSLGSLALLLPSPAVRHRSILRSQQQQLMQVALTGWRAAACARLGGGRRWSVRSRAFRAGRWGTMGTWERETAQCTGLALRITHLATWCAHRGQEATGDPSVGQSQEVLLTVPGRCHCHTDRGPGQAQSSWVPAPHTQSFLL